MISNHSFIQSLQCYIFTYLHIKTLYSLAYLTHFTHLLTYIYTLTDTHLMLKPEADLGVGQAHPRILKYFFLID